MHQVGFIYKIHCHANLKSNNVLTSLKFHNHLHISLYVYKKTVVSSTKNNKYQVVSPDDGHTVTQNM